MVILYVWMSRSSCRSSRPRADARRTIAKSGKGYYKVTSPTEIVLNRKAMNMKPAVWYGLFTGGMNGNRRVRP